MTARRPHSFALSLLLLAVVGAPACVAPPPPDAPPPVAGDVDASVAPDLGSPPPPACNATDPRLTPVEVAVLPDAGEAPFVDVLARARTRIEVMIYLMGRGAILDTLTRKARDGVRVRVILDVGRTDTNQKYFDELVAAGAQVRWSDPRFPYMHAKVLVVDAAEAVVSTSNYSQYNLLRERNLAAHVTDPQDVAQLVALFEADWDRRTPDLACTRLLVSPVNARARILALVDEARATLDLESMQLADRDVRDAVAARRRAGVRVRALLADPDWIDANADAAAFLRGAGIEARYLTRPGVHNKAIVADGARAYLGSENLSYTSLSRNREVGLIVTEPDAVRPITDTFERDWAAATPF